MNPFELKIGGQGTVTNPKAKPVISELTFPPPSLGKAQSAKVLDNDGNTVMSIDFAKDAEHK